MNFLNSTTIDASPDTLWAILATDYNNIGDWTTAVLHSEQDPDVPEGEGRIIQVPRLGEVHEPIRHFDAEKRTFTFEVIADGFRFFVKSEEVGAFALWRTSYKSQCRLVEEADDRAVHFAANTWRRCTSPPDQTDVGAAVTNTDCN